MKNTIKLSGYTLYFGFLTVFLEWTLVFICFLIVRPDYSQPFSQYGLEPKTRILFGVFFTVVSIIYYLFSRHLDRYWKYTSRLAILAGLAFTFMAWTPYHPIAGTFVPDAHTIALTISILCFTIPMLFIGFTKSHEYLAIISRISFVLIFFSTIATLAALTTDAAVLLGQMIMIVIFHSWLISTNILLLQPHEFNSNKL